VKLTTKSYQKGDGNLSPIVIQWAHLIGKNAVTYKQLQMGANDSEQRRRASNDVELKTVKRRMK